VRQRTISRVPPQIKEEEIAQVIKDFAEPIRMNIIKDKYGIQTGSRHVMIKRSTMQHIPRFLKIGNQARNQLGTPGGGKSFLRGPKIFDL